MNDIFNKFIEGLLKFANLKAIVALKDGFMITIPVTLVGSVFLLLANLPIPGYTDFMAGIFGPDWSAPLTKVSGATYDILALVVVIGIGYKYAAAEGLDGISCAAMSLISFLIITADTALSGSGELVTGVIPKGWVGGNGMITALIVGLGVSYIFCFLIKRKIGIKMPEEVPDGVKKAFDALVPAAIIFTLSAVIFGVCRLFGELTFTELVFKVLQTPLQNVSDTLGGGIFLSALMTILFWAGIHGPNIVGGIMNPIWLANALANQDVVNSGQALIAGENAKILTKQVFDCFLKYGGCGATLGLLIAVFMVARSKQLREIGKLSFVPGLFNINEPIIFGLPIMFNPFFLVPFTLVPLVLLVLIYFAIRIGFVNPFIAIEVPWTTPPVIAGFILGGFKGALVQVVGIVISVAIYLPFVKAQDKEYIKQEQHNAEESAA